MGISKKDDSGKSEVLGHDKFGTELKVGDVVMYPSVVHCKGGRGGVEFATIDRKEYGNLYLNGAWRGVRESSVVKVSHSFAKAFCDGSLFK